jgi:hypothetical protein
VLLLLNNEDVVCAYSVQHQVQQRGHKEKPGEGPVSYALNTVLKPKII